MKDVIEKIEKGKFPPSANNTSDYARGYNTAIENAVEILQSITPSPSPVTWEEAWQLAIQYADEQNILHHQPSGIMYERAALGYVKEYISTRYPLHPPMDKWIPVENDLPGNSGRVLALCEGQEYVLSYGEGKFYMDFHIKKYYEDWTEYVSHWQPLPPSPQK